ncbi:MAG TPA: PTS sugar transporter subunit IIA, partial [Pelolinea sp.]|nr:PTS sugar transporter subunit IIA [Pelolinea sp.]
KYVEGIKELLINHGPYMVLSKEVVLLHAMIGHGVNQLCMGLTTFSPPVNFGHQHNDPVSVAIVFGTVDSRSHLRALSQLSKLLGDQVFINQLKDSQSIPEVLSLVNQTVNHKN